MKLIILLAATWLMAFNVAAQASFSFTASQVDSFTTGYYPAPNAEGDTLDKMMSYIVNNGTAPIVLNWQMITGVTDRPNYWAFVGVVDNIAARSNIGVNLDDHTLQRTATILPGDSAIMEVFAFVSVYDDSGIGNFYVKVFDDAMSQVDTLYFRLHKPNPALPYPTAIGQQAAEVYDIQLFPSPAPDVLHISARESIKGARIFIYDLRGREMLKMTVGDNGKETALPLGPMAPGVYLLRVQDRKSAVIAVRKFVKM